MPQVIVDGFEVSLNDLGQFIVAPVGGVAMPVAIDDYKAGLSAKLIAECPTLEAFRARWVNPPDREEIVEMIVSAGYSPSVLRLVENMNDYDLYDVLADLAGAQAVLPERQVQPQRLLGRADIRPDQAFEAASARPCAPWSLRSMPAPRVLLVRGIRCV